MRRALLVGLAAALVLATGCANRMNLKAKSLPITILTTPPGAKVDYLQPAHLERTFLGTTPVRDLPVIVLTDVKFGKDVPVQEARRRMDLVGVVHVWIEKEGYKPYEDRLSVKLDETAVHEIALEPVDAIPDAPVEDASE